MDAASRSSCKHKTIWQRIVVWAVCVYDTSSYVSTWEGLKVRSLEVHTRQVMLSLNYFFIQNTK